MLSPPHLDRDTTVCIAGHTGFVGSARRRTFTASLTNLLGGTSRELDPRDSEAALRFFHAHGPDAVVDAARVGGILANGSQPAAFLSDVLRIQTNVLDAVHRSDVAWLLSPGPS